MSRPRVGDLAFLAARRNLLGFVLFDAPFPCRAWTAAGPDGADLALLNTAPTQRVCRRFRRIVIGSGDHALAGLADAALSSGLDAVVVGRPGSIARVYSDLGCDIRHLGKSANVAPTPTRLDVPSVPAAGDAA